MALNKKEEKVSVLVYGIGHTPFDSEHFCKGVRKQRNIYPFFLKELLASSYHFLNTLPSGLSS